MSQIIVAVSLNHNRGTVTPFAMLPVCGLTHLEVEVDAPAARLAALAGLNIQIHVAKAAENNP